MITRYDVIKALQNRESPLEYIEKSESVIDNDGFFIATIVDYTNYLRKKLNCSFQSLFYDSCSLLNVLECTECETVIFSSDNYENYEDNLRCPVCSDYKTDFDYWTRVDIKLDEKKRNTLKFYEDCNQRRDKNYRRQQETGLYSGELWKYEIKKQDKSYIYKLCVFDYFSSKIRGLHFKREVVENGFYNIDKQYKIPLGFTYIYTMYLYPFYRKITKRM